MNDMERRSFTCELRAKDDEQHGHIIEGHPIVFDERTDMIWFDEIIDKGALDKTDLKDVRFLVNHDTKKLPLARSRNNNENSTMQLKPDNEGLGIRADLDTENNADSRALYSAVERGDISGMSFMFTVRGAKWENLDSDHPTRHITDIGVVYEVSAVTFPAYEATSINARNAEALESAKATLESAREEARNKALEDAKAKYYELIGGQKHEG